MQQWAIGAHVRRPFVAKPSVLDRPLLLAANTDALRFSDDDLRHKPTALRQAPVQREAVTVRRDIELARVLASTPALLTSRVAANVGGVTGSARLDWFAAQR